MAGWPAGMRIAFTVGSRPTRHSNGSFDWDRTKMRFHRIRTISAGCCSRASARGLSERERMPMTLRRTLSLGFGLLIAIALVACLNGQTTDQSATNADSVASPDQI